MAATSDRRWATALRIGETGISLLDVFGPTVEAVAGPTLGSVAGYDAARTPDRASDSTSSRVTRPPGPEPVTIARSTPRSLPSLRTAGGAVTDVAPAAASTSNVASGAPTASLSPAPTCGFATLPT